MKNRFFQLKIEKIAVVQLAVLKIEFEQKWIGRVEMNPQRLAALKPDLLKRNSGDFCIAQVTVSENTGFETAPMEIEVGKAAAYKSTGIIFSGLKVDGLEILEGLVREIRHEVRTESSLL